MKNEAPLYQYTATLAVNWGSVFDGGANGRTGPFIIACYQLLAAGQAVNPIRPLT